VAAQAPHATTQHIHVDKSRMANRYVALQTQCPVPNAYLKPSGRLNASASTRAQPLVGSASGGKAFHSMAPKRSQPVTNHEPALTCGKWQRASCRSTAEAVSGRKCRAASEHK